MKVRYSARANRHIDAIHDHIDRHDSEAATRVIAHISGTLQSLEEFPYLGRVQAIPATRKLIIPRLPFVAMYRTVGDTVIILGVYHCAQDR